MSHSALANLTAQYTDSENEDDRKEDDSPETDHSVASQVITIHQHQLTPVQTPEKSKIPNKSLRLVSYQDDTVVSDDENMADASSSDEEQQNSDENTSRTAFAKDQQQSALPIDDIPPDEINSNKALQAAKDTKHDKYAHYGFSLPPEPKGKPSVELTEKIRNLFEKKETSNMDMNRIIQERKEFRNPSIYEKLIQYCDINELGTNYPPEIYDPLQWGTESFYEELAKAQKNEMLKRQKERKDNDKIEQATAAARKVEEEAKKRKSKWDQPAPMKSNLGAPALTTTVTGTKGTVISAFGSLPKKPNI